MRIKISDERKEVLRFIRKNVIKKLSPEGDITGDTAHTHANKESLDRLTIDSNKNLLIDNELIDPLLRQEDW